MFQRSITRLTTLALACAAMATLTACDPKPQAPKAASLAAPAFVQPS